MRGRGTYLKRVVDGRNLVASSLMVHGSEYCLEATELSPRGVRRLKRSTTNV